MDRSYCLGSLGFRLLEGIIIVFSVDYFAIGGGVPSCFLVLLKSSRRELKPWRLSVFPPLLPAFGPFGPFDVLGRF